MSRARANADATSQTYIENATAAQELSGTYSTERLYFNDSYQLTGDVTVTGHLALGSIADEDVVITQDSTERTITGSGTLEAGNVLQDTHRTSLTDMTGTLANSVQDNVTRLGTVTTGTFNGTLDSTTFSGDAGKKTAKVWARFEQDGTHSITESYNVSSISDTAAGHSVLTFLAAMPSANYCVVGSAIGNTLNGSYYDTMSSGTSNTTTQVNVMFKLHNSATTADVNSGSIIIFGE